MCPIVPADMVPGRRVFTTRGYDLNMPTNSTRNVPVGWPFVAGAVLGIVLQLVGAMIPAFVFLGTAALGAAIWFYGAGHDEGH